MNDSLRDDPLHDEDRLLARLDRFLAGECDADEAAAVRGWLAADPARRDVLGSVQMMRAVAADRPPSRSASTAWREAVAELGLDGSASGGDIESRDSVVTTIRKAPATDPFGRRTRWRGRIGVGLAAAAAIVIAVAGRSWLDGSALHGPVTPALQDIATKRGQRLTIRLPDGSEVTLAPESRVRVLAGYGKPARAVELVGQAHFVVTHDDARPFTVRTAKLVARDLGTRFVVRAYPEERITDVIVAEGKVAVTAATGTTDTLILERGDRGRVADDGRLTLARDMALDPYFSWTAGRLVFQRVPLHEVVARLERWYAIEIAVENGIPDLPITAAFDNEPSDVVLHAIATALDLRVVAVPGGYELQPSMR